MVLDLFSSSEANVGNDRQVQLSELALGMLKKAKDKKSKLMISVKPCEVILSDTDIGLVNTFDNFSCIDTRGFKKHGWEEYLCKVSSLDYWELKSTFPFQKDRFKYYTYKLGVTPKKFISMFNASMVRAHIPVEFYDLAKKLIKGSRGHYDTRAIISLNTNKKVLLECIDDNMTNVIPFILFLGDMFWKGKDITVSSLRGILGKGLWKKVLKNSITRNKSLALSFSIRRGIKELQEIPSSLLSRVRVNYYQESRVPTLIEANVLKKMKCLTKKDLHKKVIDTIYDTKRMYNTLGKDVPKQHIQWDYTKWVEQHDYCVEQIRLKNYSKDKFKSVVELDKEYLSKCSEYKALLLDNAFDIKTEGDIMHHCVGSYSTDVKEGHYLVFSILDKEGKRSSTLGISLRGGIWSFNQHYGHCNARVENEKEIQFAKDITKSINKQIKLLEGE